MTRKGKKRQTRSALVKVCTMGKECTKSACHNSSKVPATESTKAKPKEDAICGKCKQAGHTGLKCPMLKRSTRSKAELLNWDTAKLSIVDQLSKKLRIMKHKVELLDW